MRRWRRIPQGAARGPTGCGTTSATQSAAADEWVTAFVCAYLDDIAESRRSSAAHEPPCVCDSAPTRAGLQRLGGLRLHSTAWAAIALQPAELSSSADVAPTLSFIVAHQHSGGGFSTYADRYRPRDATLRRDWFLPQPCVAAAAVLALTGGRCFPDLRRSSAAESLYLVSTLIRSTSLRYRARWCQRLRP